MGHITHLPVELLLLLFTYLDLSSINNLRITCHLLYVQTPNRIRYHTLILPRSLQLSSTLTQFALWRKNNALPYIKNLVITGEGTITPALAVNFLTACPNLERLSISNHSTFSIDYFVNLLDSIGQLRNASVINKRQWKLQSIEITYCVGVHQYSKDISVPFQRSTIAALERKLSQLKPQDSAAVSTFENDSPHLQPDCELSSARVEVIIHECNRQHWRGRRTMQDLYKECQEYVSLVLGTERLSKMRGG
ncbi:1017_t:CDS:2 [Paraglomus occultum]|uniref:1017_t:CDS:1 n=1 Tax=Paraglomus occultum TaxID=144539 RepID=A0A9N8VMV8_9GLOM|nr:1017_t:CDS:2 [Paraglomus occultum]